MVIMGLLILLVSVNVVLMVSVVTDKVIFGAGGNGRGIVWVAPVVMIYVMMVVMKVVFKTDMMKRKKRTPFIINNH